MPAVVCGFIERIRWCKFSGRHEFKCIMTSVSSESTEIRRNKEPSKYLTFCFESLGNYILPGVAIMIKPI